MTVQIFMPLIEVKELIAKHLNDKFQQGKYNSAEAFKSEDIRFKTLNGEESGVEVIKVLRS